MAGQEISTSAQRRIGDACWQLLSADKDVDGWDSKRFERLSEELNAFNLSPLAWGLEAELSAIADKLTSLAENSVGETDWDQAAREIVGALKECDIPVALTQNREISSGAKIVRHILITYAKTRSRLSDDAFVKALSRALKDRN